MFEIIFLCLAALPYLLKHAVDGRSNMAVVAGKANIFQFAAFMFWQFSSGAPVSIVPVLFFALILVLLGPIFFKAVFVFSIAAFWWMGMQTGAAIEQATNESMRNSVGDMYLGSIMLASYLSWLGYKYLPESLGELRSSLWATLLSIFWIASSLLIAVSLPKEQLILSFFSFKFANLLLVLLVTNLTAKGLFMMVRFFIYQRTFLPHYQAANAALGLEYKESNSPPELGSLDSLGHDVFQNLLDQLSWYFTDHNSRIGDFCHQTSQLATDMMIAIKNDNSSLENWRNLYRLFNELLIGISYPLSTSQERAMIDATARKLLSQWDEIARDCHSRVKSFSLSLSAELSGDAGRSRIAGSVVELNQYQEILKTVLDGSSFRYFLGKGHCLLSEGEVVYTLHRVQQLILECEARLNGSNSAAES